MVIGFIVYTPQAPGVNILQQDDRDVEEDEEKEYMMDAVLGGDQDMV